MTTSPVSALVARYPIIVEAEPHTGSEATLADALSQPTTSVPPRVRVRATSLAVQGLFPGSVIVRAVTFQRTDESLTDASREIRHERVELPEDLTSAAPRRVATFIAGRHCAIHAMTELGVTEGKVLRGKVGSPRWPRGVVGSIAHTDDLAIAAVASARDARSVGVDCERIMTTETADNVREAVAQELRHPGTEVNWRDATEEGAVTCVFSAKETLYKCLNPLTGIFFGFDDASVVRGDLAEGWLELRLNRSLSDAFRRGSIYTVRIVRHRGYFVSGMLLES